MNEDPKRAPEHQDVLDQMIRSSLNRQVSGSQPPDLVWKRIRSQVRAGPTRRRRIEMLQFTHLLGGIVQGAAVMIIIALVSVSLAPSPRAVAPQSTAAAAPQPVAMAVAVSLPLDLPPDVPHRQSNVAPAHVKAFQHSANSGDMLNVAALQRAGLAPHAPQLETLPFNPAFLQLTNPALDPVLSSRQL